MESDIIYTAEFRRLFSNSLSRSIGPSTGGDCSSDLLTTVYLYWDQKYSTSEFIVYRPKVTLNPLQTGEMNSKLDENSRDGI